MNSHQQENSLSRKKFVLAKRRTFSACSFFLKKGMIQNRIFRTVRGTKPISCYFGIEAIVKTLIIYYFLLYLVSTGILIWKLHYNARLSPLNLHINKVYTSDFVISVRLNCSYKSVLQFNHFYLCDTYKFKVKPLLDPQMATCLAISA